MGFYQEFNKLAEMCYLPKLEVRDDCKKCDGKGYYFVANGEDDIDKEMCEYCNNLDLQAEENKAMAKMDAEDAQQEILTD
jgi:hypothetical protein